MTHEEGHQIPIWFFIGLTLLGCGVIILGYGLVTWASPARAQIAMGHLHADVWWGAFMSILGAFYTLRFRPGHD